MSQLLTESELRTHLPLNATPLAGIADNAQEWLIGPLSLSKHYASFRAGFGSQLANGAEFFKQQFDIEGRRGCAIVFRSMGTPPLYFAGWVPPEREREADQWIAFLNDQIAKRHAGIDSRHMQDAAEASQEYEYQEEIRRSHPRRGPRPSKLVK